MKTCYYKLFTWQGDAKGINKVLCLIALIGALLFNLNFSCKKEENSLQLNDAVIRDYGDPAVNGCGWVILVSSNVYKPINLSPEFYIDSLEVKMKYELLSTKANCGFQEDVYSEIKIKHIEKK